MAFEGFFGGKKTKLRVPLPPKEELPNFPSPKSVNTKPTEKKIVVKKEKKEKEPEKSWEKIKPIYLKVHNFKQMKDNMDQLRVKLRESEDIINRLTEFKTDEDRVFKKWHATVKDIHEKYIYVDEIIFRGR